jgi:hypothetical protein
VMQGKRSGDGYASENYWLLRRKNEFNSFRLKTVTTKHEWQCSFMTEETNVIRILKYSACLLLWWEPWYYLPPEKPENDNYHSRGTRYPMSLTSELSWLVTGQGMNKPTGATHNYETLGAHKHSTNETRHLTIIIKCQMCYLWPCTSANKYQMLRHAMHAATPDALCFLNFILHSMTTPLQALRPPPVVSIWRGIFWKLWSFCFFRSTGEC